MFSSRFVNALETFDNAAFYKIWLVAQSYEDRQAAAMETKASAEQSFKERVSFRGRTAWSYELSMLGTPRKHTPSPRQRSNGSYTYAHLKVLNYNPSWSQGINGIVRYTIGGAPFLHYIPTPSHSYLCHSPLSTGPSSLLHHKVIRMFTVVIWQVNLSVSIGLRNCFKGGYLILTLVQ